MADGVPSISVLLVEDDDDDYLFTCDLIAQVGGSHDIARTETFEAGAAALRAGGADICLVDYRLGPETGIELVRMLVDEGCDIPMVILTGQGDHDIDVEAAAAGAADFLVKGEITPTLLERTMRYAMQTHRHVAELRSQEENLRRAQRTEAVGQLAAGIAHDFNNLLVVIRGYSTLILEGTSQETVREQAGQIDLAADKAAELTRQLLAYGRQQLLQPKTADLNSITQDTLGMLERLIGEDIEIRTSYHASLPSVVVDSGQISQVILNLAINARDAMPEGGTLSIRTATAEIDQDYARLHAEVVPGRYALLEITDTGSGMDEAIRERAFDPYFTTKGEGKGTGLGLATVYGIVRQSGGHIWLYSEPGLGTTFKLYFPTGVGLELPPEEPVDQGSLDGTETILVVEDAEIVRKLVTTVLESFGYVVHSATNGEEALKIAEQLDYEIDLVFSDVVMPGMNGRELAERLVERKPTIRMLFSSGYPDDTIIRQGIAAARFAFIQKPYVSVELAQKVRSVLEATESDAAVSRR
jgi:signal transduction histidine kinase